MNKSISKNAVARIIMYALNLLVPVLVGPYLARILAVDLYAEYNAGLSIMQWFIPFSVFGIYTYGMRQASRDRDDAQRMSKVFTQLFVMGILSTTLVLAVYLFFVTTVQNTYFWIYLLLGIQIAATYFAVEWVNEALENYTFILYKTAAIRLLYIISVFVFVKDAQDILPYTFISSIVLLLNNLFGFVYIKRKIPFVKISRKDIVSLVKPLFLVLLLSNANMLFLMLDRLFLSLFSAEVDKVNVTYYTMAMLIVSAIMNVMNSIMYVTVPRLSNLFGNRQMERFQELLKISSHAFFLLSIPAFAGIAALGPEIIYVYGGENYVAAGVVLVVFGLRFILNTFDLSLSNQVLFVAGMEKRMLAFYVAGGTLNLVFNTILLFINQLTPVILITTTLLCDLFIVYLQNRHIKKKLGKEYSPLDKETLKYLFAAILFLPVAWLLRKAFAVQLIMDAKFFLFLGTTMLICALLYWAVLHFSKDIYYQYFLKKIVSKGKAIFSRRKAS